MKVFALVIKDADLSVEIFTDYHKAQMAAVSYCEQCWDTEEMGIMGDLYNDDIIERYQEYCPDTKIYIVERTVDTDSKTIL